MEHTLDKKRLFIFLGLAFGIAWAIGLIIYVTGGLVNSPMLIPPMGISLATVLLAVGYMWAPALANVLTRLITREGWANNQLRPNLKRGWPFWLAAWFGPAVLTLLGGVVFFAIFPNLFDSQLSMVRQQFELAGVPAPDNLWSLIALQLGVGVLISPLINSLFTFGEEFGWRGYLLQKLMPLGSRKAMLLMGVIWGAWHWPVTAMGHNYGLDYPGYPWLGMLAMVWFCFVTGTFLAWATLRAGSVWPAVIGHAAINGFAGAMVVFLNSEPNMLLGPTPVGLIGSAAWSLVALWLMLRPHSFGQDASQPAPAAEMAEAAS